GGVGGGGVGDRGGRVVLEQQQRDRPADEARAADHDGALAGGVDVLAAQKLENAEWRGRDESGVSLGQSARVVRVKPVDIFMWWDLFECLVRIETIRQWQLE